VEFRAGMKARFVPIRENAQAGHWSIEDLRLENYRRVQTSRGYQCPTTGQRPDRDFVHHILYGDAQAAIGRFCFGIRGVPFIFASSNNVMFLSRCRIWTHALDPTQ
jgi:hypothetical protein